MDVDCHWSLPPTDPSLSGDEVHIWCACLNQPDTFIGQMAQTLSADELKRAERFHFLQHRNQFIVAHGLLRKLLADYTNNEIAILPSIPKPEKNEAFYKFWTRKEAHLKATGESLSAASKTIDMSSHPTNAAVFVDERGSSKDKKHWYVQDLRPVSGFAAAFAVEGGKVRYRCRQIPKFCSIPD